MKVLGEGFTIEEEEDMIVRSVHKLWIMQSRYKIEVDMMTAGNWVMIEGIDKSIAKTATLYHASAVGFDIFKPLEFHTEAVVKLACEPLNPSELPKLLDGCVQSGSCVFVARVGHLVVDCLFDEILVEGTPELKSVVRV